eukprot:4982010-Alexandrium_andersonii.AAC.1
MCIRDSPCPGRGSRGPPERLQELFSLITDEKEFDIRCGEGYAPGRPAGRASSCSAWNGRKPGTPLAPPL